MKPILTTWIYISLLCIAAFAAGCNKDFEDGPSFSLRSKEARITGSKTIESYVVNGIDSTFVFDSIYAGSDYAQNGITWVRGESSVNPILCSPCLPGRWEISEDGKQLRISWPAWAIGQPGNLEIWNYGYRGAYDIQRLTERELWVRAVVSGNVVEIKFKKV